MNNVLIRAAGPNDASGIAKIHVETWQYAYRGQIPESILNNLSIEKRTKMWTEALGNKKPQWEMFIATQGRHILGFCTVGPSRDDDANKLTGEVYAIYIDKNAMNKKIGTALMDKGLLFLKDQGFTTATLWVLDTNDKARQFYEKGGWHQEGKTKVDERDGFELHETRYIINLHYK